jgi:hypothetical protein
MTDPELLLDETTCRRLARGEIIIVTESVPGFSIPRVCTLAVVDAPPTVVWPIIDRVGDYARTMVGIKRSEELLRSGDIVRARLTVNLPFPLRDLTAVTEGVHTAREGELYKREWGLVEGDYRENSGSWTLVPFDHDPARTLARYLVHAVPRIPVPRSLQRALQRKTLPRLIAQLRSYSSSSRPPQHEHDVLRVSSDRDG